MQYKDRPFDPHVSELHLKPIIRMTDFLDNASLFLIISAFDQNNGLIKNSRHS